MKITNQRLKLLIEELELVPKESLKDAYDYAEKNHQPLAEVIVEKNLMNDDHIGRIVADELGYEFVDLDDVAIEPEVLNIIPRVMAEKQKVIAFERNKEGIKLAMVNPANLRVINLIEKKTGQEVIPYYTTEENLRTGLASYQTGIQNEFSKIIEENLSAAKRNTKAEDLPIIKIVDTVMQYAHENKASDVHIEPGEEKTLVRFRVDGILHDIIELPHEIHELIITRLKIISKLRTDEHRSAQDGKFRFKVGEKKIDVRLSILPIVEGEKAVMRLLSDRSGQFTLEDLGMGTEDLIKVKKEYGKPYGLIMTTGPTGSGKSTTLYAIMRVLNQREVNIATIEDPVEYDVDGINQVQVNAKTNLTFANGLRSILRQDPDIIMVGEIRDQETADIAINSAMTGHLVLTTLHTNDAPTALPRLVEMDIEPFLIASTVNLVMAQRLVRKICSHCVVSETVTQKDLKEKFSEKLIEQHFGKEERSFRIYHGKGCRVCGSTGYAGRVAIFEVLVVTEEIRKLIMRRANADEIRDQARKEGMKTMIEDGVKKVLAGVTTIEEVLRATRE